MEALDRTVSAAEPGVTAFSRQTIPEVGQLVRDLRETTMTINQLTERLNNQGASSLLGAQDLPDYEPR